MRNVFGRSFTLATAIVIGLAGKAIAGDGCCAQCGCDVACQKVCRLVCEERTVEITCWGCKCEDFCLLGHSQPGRRHCEVVCESCDASCDPKVPYARSKNFVWREWIPGCARAGTKKKLMKKTVTKKVPSYKWVVEDLCSGCEAKTVGADPQPGFTIPPPPVADAVLKYGHIEATSAPTVSITDLPRR